MPKLTLIFAVACLLACNAYAQPSIFIPDDNKHSKTSINIPLWVSQAQQMSRVKSTATIYIGYNNSKSLLDSLAKLRNNFYDSALNYGPDTALYNYYADLNFRYTKILDLISSLSISNELNITGILINSDTTEPCPFPKAKSIHFEKKASSFKWKSKKIKIKFSNE